MEKIKKTVFILSLAFAGARTALAQESLVVYSNTEDTPPRTVALADIAKITFNDESLVIHGAEDKITSFAFSEVRSIKFANLSTGISNPCSDGADGTVLYFRGGYVGADNWTAGMSGTAIICDVSGRVILTLRRWNGQPVSVAGLDKGIYIFKVNNKSIKFTLL